jgi:hypothetical protein
LNIANNIVQPDAYHQGMLHLYYEAYAYLANRNIIRDDRIWHINYASPVAWEEYMVASNAPRFPNHELHDYTLAVLDIYRGPGTMKRFQPVQVGMQWGWGRVDVDPLSIATGNYTLPGGYKLPSFGHIMKKAMQCVWNTNAPSTSSAKYTLPGGYQLTSFQHIRDRFCFQVSSHVPLVPPALTLTGCDDNDPEWIYYMAFVMGNGREIGPECYRLWQNWGARKEDFTWQVKWWSAKVKDMKRLDQAFLDQRYGKGVEQAADESYYMNRYCYYCVDPDPNAVMAELEAHWNGVDYFADFDGAYVPYEEEVPLVGVGLFDDDQVFPVGIPGSPMDSGFVSDVEINKKKTDQKTWAELEQESEELSRLLRSRRMEREACSDKKIAEIEEIEASKEMERIDFLYKMRASRADWSLAEEEFTATFDVLKAIDEAMLAEKKAIEEAKKAKDREINNEMNKVFEETNWSDEEDW